MHRQFKSDFIMEPYLSEINSLPLQVLVSKVRASDHRLEVESGRYHRPRKNWRTENARHAIFSKTKNTVF